MNIVKKVLGIVCYVVTAFWILVSIVSFTTPEIGAVAGIFFLILALAFALIGRHVFKKPKLDSMVSSTLTPTTMPKMPVVNEPKDPQEAQAPIKASNKDEIKQYKCYVAGLYYRQEELVNDVLSENPDYSMTKKEIIDACMEDERIYQYELFYAAADLVPEPNNPHDPNAIKVIVYDTHIGYIPAEKTKSVKKIMDTKNIVLVGCEIYGGPYKVLPDENSSIVRGSDNFKSSICIEYK